MARQLPTLKTDGNPEGKGLNGFLLDWAHSAPRGVVAKPRRQILAEFFTSMLVLSAQFKFKPVVGALTYLYWLDGKWSLSLIAPDEWTELHRQNFAGICVLQSDMTWTISPSELLKQDNAVSRAFGDFCESFSQTLDSDLSLEEILPFYAEGVHYYQRLYASALSRSVRGSLILGDDRESSCRHYAALLPLLLSSYSEEESSTE